MALGVRLNLDIYDVLNLWMWRETVLALRPSFHRVLPPCPSLLSLVGSIHTTDWYKRLVDAAEAATQAELVSKGFIKTH